MSSVLNPPRSPSARAPRRAVLVAVGVAAVAVGLLFAAQQLLPSAASVRRITVQNPKSVCRGVSRVVLDGTTLPGEGLIPLSDDGREHQVQVVLG